MTTTNQIQDEMRYALVTGAASGLGRAITLRLAHDGYCVAIADIDDAGSAETLRMVESAGGSGRIEQLDVAKFDEWQTLVSRLQADWPQLDILVNNAGVACSGRVGMTPIDDWRWLVDINLFGVIHGCHTCVDWLKQNANGGRIINIASAAGLLVPPAMGAYNVAKAGVVALSETLAGELQGSKVRVTVACPGFFRTQLLNRARFHAELERANAEWYTDTAPLDADQIAAAIVRAADRGKLYVCVPARARWLWYFKRMMPRVWLKVVGFAYRRQLVKSQASHKE